MSTAKLPVFIPVFDQIVDKFGNHPAIVESGFVNCSYSQLCERAKRLAAFMQAAGTTKGDVVAIAIEKSADYVCALLAVWYTGAAFVPVDPNLPGERMILMCDEARVKTVLAVSGRAPEALRNATSSGRTIVEIDKVETDSRFNPDFPPFNRPTYDAEDLAYIIFTSGSTGLPKGVQVTHRGIVSFLQAQIAAFELTSRSRSLWYLSTSFDASVSDLGTALLAGAALYIEPANRLQPGSGLEEILRERGITYVDIPPSMLRLIDPSALPPSLKSIVIGGEACALDVVRAFATKVKLINVYGPTESTVCTSLGTCGGDWNRPLIGQPLPGITYRILDQDLNELGPLEAGQLHIGGIGLASGYLNRPELTAAKFIHHPLTGERLYRTGDLVMLTEDGEYQFLGRTDRQFKLRGMLVEPEEIEAKLLQHPTVERAAVLKRPVKPGVAREILVAFVSA
ncbi:MAG: amino acid adenylation domain-containing protein, partial [Cyanobacteria bacterium SZAS LIN-2]|nr:amino acid adenylation domain-containing protein [Cyanobacteria bacterium SZAS LIN-2]